MRHLFAQYWLVLAAGILLFVGVALHRIADWSVAEDSREQARNDLYAPPSDEQVRWHIRHVRQDLRFLVRYLALTIALLAAMLLVLVAILAEMYLR
jgi:hypothetical protein